MSGYIGDHGIAVLLARGELGISADITSDTAPLNGLVAALLDGVGPNVHVLRDATRGGVATVLNEVALASGVGVVLAEEAIPVRSEVFGVCEMLGIDPLYVACEGRMVVVVDGRVCRRCAGRHACPSDGTRQRCHRRGQRAAPRPRRGRYRLRGQQGGRHAGRRPSAAHLLGDPA